MQAVGPAAPEFDGLSVDCEACPVRRARNFFGIERGDLCCPCFEGGAIGKRPRLIGGKRANLAATRTAVEICVSLLRRHLGGEAFDADLAAERLPVKAQRNMGIGTNLQTLAALV